MGITITNFWKLFCYGVRRDHYNKLIGIREFLERLALDCFNNNILTDTVTLEKNIPPLDEVDEGKKVYTCRAIHFFIYIYPSTEVSTISNITTRSDSLVTSNIVSYC